MDPARFDRLVRAVAATPTRRRVSQVLAGLVASGVIESARRDEVTAKKRCKPCRRRKKGTCKGKKPNDTSCNGEGKCFAGTCIPRPTCVGNAGNCSQAVQCCSGFCDGIECFAGGAGTECYETSDCTIGLSCIGYRCR
jgi:hypothetical protein